MLLYIKNILFSIMQHLAKLRHFIRIFPCIVDCIMQEIIFLYFIISLWIINVEFYFDHFLTVLILVAMLWQQEVIILCFYKR